MTKMKIPKKKLRQKAESLKNLIDDILDDKINLPENALVTDSESTFSIITRRRMELVNAINLYQPNSVQELADITNRSKQAVDRDLKILERFEVIKLEKEGRNVFPIVTRDIIVMSLSKPKPKRKILPAEVFIDDTSVNKMIMGVLQ